MEEIRKTKKDSNKTRIIILCVALIILLVCAAIIGSFIYRIFKDPGSLFHGVSATQIPDETAFAPAFDVPERTPSVPTPQPTDDPASTADNTEQPRSDEMLNILLAGIDAREDGSTTSGTTPHTDVVMVITINFTKDTIDLITLPRDTLTTAPGHYGYYKLNGVFNVGLEGKFNTTGKADDLASGFELTSRAAEQWLGGISIPYYYGFDFQAVIDIVNAIGGIDYNVDQPFYSFYGKIYYGKGMHHLDGDAVMGYIRIRHQADGLDSSRTARQRKMLVALFKKLKNESKLSQIPALISAANSGIYTNTTLAQTTAVVNFAQHIDPDEIRTRAMYGEIGDIEYDWRYVYVDQQNRIDLIKEVYGIDAEPVGISTRQYERWLHKIGFESMKHIHQIEKVLKRVQEKKDAGYSFSDEQIAFYSKCYADYLNLREAYEAYSEELADIYARNPWREKKKNWTDEQIRLDKELSEKEKMYREKLNELSNEAKKSLYSLASSIGYYNISWTINGKWYNDKDINEVTVRFG